MTSIAPRQRHSLAAALPRWDIHVLLVNIAICIGLMYVVLYMVTDSAQQFFYDQVVEGLWWRAFVCAAPIGLMMAALPFRFDEAFISGLHWIILQMILWSVLLRYVCKYDLGHAVFIGCVGYVLFAWIATMALDSLNQVGVAPS